MGYNLDLLKMMEFIFSMGNPLLGESIGVFFVFVCVMVPEANPWQAIS